MDEQQNEFSLEDILKEFGQPAEEDIPQEEPEEEQELPAEPQPPEEPAPPVEKPQFTQDTVRLSDLSEVLHTQEQAPAPEETPQPEQAEQVPFAEGWEPEYEEPIADYIPPEPIVFRPRSRLQELKHKLIEGPEKRYYELSELGLGKPQMAALCNLLMALVAALTTVLYNVGTISTGRLRFVIFVQFLSLLVSAMLGSYQLMSGAADMVKKRFSLNSLLIFSLVACLVDGVLCLRQQRVPCCAAFSLHMTMSLWSEYQRRSAEMGQMDTMRKAIRLDRLAAWPDYTDGRPALVREEGQVEDFMDNYAQRSGPERVLSVYALVALLLSLAIGIVAGVLHGLSMGVQIFAVTLLLAVPATSFIVVSRPMAILERRLHKLGSVLCGWQGVKQLSKPSVFPLSDGDLFPQGSMRLNGLKFYGQRDPDQVVAYATAVVDASGGGLAPLFDQLLDSRSGRHYEAQSFRPYAGGIGAEVDGEAVLVGTLNFMQDMGVDMPEGARVNQAVYAAVDGELCGVFAVAYAKNKSTAMGLNTLCAYRHLSPLVQAKDFMLTESFLQGKFSVNTRRMIFADDKLRKELEQKERPEELQPLALTTREGLASMAYAVTGARALYKAGTAGVAVQMIAGILAMVMMLVLAIVGAEWLLTPTRALLYELLWLVPGLLITEGTRHI